MPGFVGSLSQTVNFSHSCECDIIPSMRAYTDTHSSILSSGGITKGCLIIVIITAPHSREWQLFWWHYPLRGASETRALRLKCAKLAFEQAVCHVHTGHPSHCGLRAACIATNLIRIHFSETFLQAFPESWHSCFDFLNVVASTFILVFYLRHSIERYWSHISK